MASNIIDEDTTDDAVRQMAAGIVLIKMSSLLVFDENTGQFSPAEMDSFERAASQVHPKFGRVMKWIWFSAGAEYLLKGALISTGDFVPSTGKPKLDFPGQKNAIDAWIDRAFTTAERSEKKDYKTMSDMQEGLKKICKRNSGEERTGKQLRAAFLILGEALRNRDAHAYVPDVRIGHFHLLHLFAPACNTLLAWAEPDVVEMARAQAA